jgi:hypothetical protein
MSKKQNNVLIINKITEEIPQNITDLIFNQAFNQKVDNLPQNITYIDFGNCFNQKVDKLPKNLTHLFLFYYFNQKIDKLPKNLTHLTLNSIKFNKSINNLPKSLTYFMIGWHINSDIKLPKNFNYLLLTCNNKLINNIPVHIKILNICFHYEEKENKYIENLPLTIKEIIIEKIKYKKYIKIPFGTILTIKKFD